MDKINVDSRISMSNKLIFLMILLLLIPINNNATPTKGDGAQYINLKEQNSVEMQDNNQFQALSVGQELVLNTVPQYMFGFYDTITNKPMFWRQLGLIYDSPNAFPDGIDSGLLDPGVDLDIIISLVPNFPLKLYLDNVYSGDVDLLLYSGDVIAGPPIATSTNDQGSDEWLTFTPTIPMNVTVRIRHDAADSTYPTAGGTLYLGQYGLTQGIYTMFIEGKNFLTDRPLTRTNYYIPHVIYEVGGTSGIYLASGSDIDMYQMRVYDDYSYRRGIYYGNDLYSDNLDDAITYGANMTMDINLNEGFRFELEGEWGADYVTIAITNKYYYSFYDHASSVLNWIPPQYQTYNDSRPVIPIIVGRYGDNGNDYLYSSGIYNADTNTYVTGLTLSDTTIPLGINTFTVMPSYSLSPNDYYMKIYMADGAANSEYFYYYFTISSGIDTTAPTINSIFQDTDEAIPGSNVLIYSNITDSLSLVDSATLYYRKGTSGAFTSYLMKNLFSGIFSGFIPLPATTFNLGDKVQYYISAIDQFGNEVIDNNSGLYYELNLMDTKPPLIGDVSHTPLNPTIDDSIDIIATITDNYAMRGSTVYYRVNSGSWQSVIMDVSTDIYNATIGPFNANEIVEYYIEAEDSSGFIAQSDITSLVITDINAPIISDISHSPTDPTIDDQIAITATVTDGDSVQSVTLYYQINNGAWQNIAMSGAGNIYSVNIGSFNTNEQIKYYIKAEDISGNTASSSYKYFTVYDIVAPIISNISHSPSNPTKDGQIVISATVTDGDSVSSVTLNYRTKRGTKIGYWQTTNMIVTTNNVYSAKIGPFDPNSIIEYFISSQDPSGNEFVSSTYSFIIQADSTSSSSTSFTSTTTSTTTTSTTTTSITTSSTTTQTSPTIESTVQRTSSSKESNFPNLTFIFLGILVITRIIFIKRKGNVVIIDY